MKNLIIVLSLLLLVSLTQQCEGFRHSRLRDIVKEKKKETNNNNNAATKKYKDVTIKFVDQPVDHFQRNNTLMMKQRYFYSARYVNGQKVNRPSYAFVCVGGEGPEIDSSILVDSNHCSGDMVELAKKLSKFADVHLFALEHRYYGQSIPAFKDNKGKPVSALNNQNIKYLNSKQALSDLARLIIHIKEDDHNLITSKTKWVTFGGGYAGFLAAYARVWFPHLIHAAVSSSAPTKLQINFPEYKERQALDLQYETVGGSSKCLKIVLDGHAEIASLLKKKQYKQLTDIFNICSEDLLKDEKNVRLWLGDGVVDIPAQSNDPSCHKDGDACNIEAVCDILVHSAKGSTSLEALAVLADIQNESKGRHGQKDTCTRFSWKNTLSALSNPHSAGVDSWVRSWQYQVCTEFGMFPTCESNSLCPFGQGFRTEDTDFELCQATFGLDKYTVTRQVKETAGHYSDMHQRKGSRILSVNGDVDPLSTLALTTSEDEVRLPTYSVKGASHHFWTHPVKATDDQEIRDAREIIFMKVQQWLEEDDCHSKKEKLKTTVPTKATVTSKPTSQLESKIPKNKEAGAVNKKVESPKKSEANTAKNKPGKEKNAVRKQS